MSKLLKELGIEDNLVYQKNGADGEGFVVKKDNPKISMACYVDEANGKLYAASSEMLEALIDEVLFQEDNMLDGIDDAYKTMVSIIEKACYPKTWPEIKELR